MGLIINFPLADGKIEYDMTGRRRELEMLFGHSLFLILDVFIVPDVAGENAVDV